jgi:hypothetical protein
MFKTIIYLIITLIIIHFTLYYFNFDFSVINIFKKNVEMQDIENIIPEINVSINELKTLNECINNGQINTTIS